MLSPEEQGIISVNKTITISDKLDQRVFQPVWTYMTVAMRGFSSMKLLMTHNQRERGVTWTTDVRRVRGLCSVV